MKYNTLILSGGGTKGVFYVGCIKALEELGVLDSINTYVGVSIGAIVSTLLCIGYKSGELFDVFNGLDINSYEMVDVSNLLTNFGLDNGDKIARFIDDLVFEKTKIRGATIGDIERHTGNRLYIGATLINRNKFVFLRDKKILLCDAIRSSICVPIYLSPCKIYPDHLFVDGGITNNFPINLFNREGVLGIKFNVTKELYKVDSPVSYITTLFSIISNNICRDKSGETKATILTLDTPNLNILDLKFTNHSRFIELVLSGYRQTLTKFKPLDDDTSTHS